MSEPFAESIRGWDPDDDSMEDEYERLYAAYRQKEPTSDRVRFKELLPEGQEYPYLVEHKDDFEHYHWTVYRNLRHRSTQGEVMLWQALQGLRGQIKSYADELDEWANEPLVTIRESATMNRCATELRAILDSPKG